MRQLKIASEKITHRTENTNRYFREVEQCSTLTPDEEFNLGLSAQNGDEQAIERLISSNLRFVISVAKQYAGTSIHLEELISQGNIGLCHAARTFDPTRGFKFISYAVWHIRKEILSYFASDHRTVRLPQNVLNDLNKIRKANEEILQQESRPATDEELQEILQRDGKAFSIDHIKRINESFSRGMALDSTDIEEGLSPIDWLSSDDSTSELVDRDDSIKIARAALASLSFIERDIIMSRLGFDNREPESLESIAWRYDRTQEWARSVYSRSIKKLKTRTRHLNRI